MWEFEIHYLSYVRQLSFESLCPPCLSGYRFSVEATVLTNNSTCSSQRCTKASSYDWFIKKNSYRQHIESLKPKVSSFLLLLLLLLLLCYLFHFSILNKTWLFPQLVAFTQPSLCMFGNAAWTTKCVYLWLLHYKLYTNSCQLSKDRGNRKWFPSVYE